MAVGVNAPTAIHDRDFWLSWGTYLTRCDARTSPDVPPLICARRGTNRVTSCRQLLRVITRKELMVSVQTQLGLHDEGNGLLAHAGQNWASWADRFPCLLGIGG